MSNVRSWEEFCAQYIGSLLVNEWMMLEDDYGLNFVEVMEGGRSELFHSDLRWTDMVYLVGEQGIRAPDAMILNMFIKSKFPLLITTDGDFDSALLLTAEAVGKAIFIL